MERNEHSYGIIPLKIMDGEYRTLLVKHGKGHWAFPKGHPEQGETPFETASRELKEETALEVEQVLDHEPLQEQYIFRSEKDLIYKTVTYFVALVKGEVIIQAKEIADFRWVTLKEAEKLATFSESKALCRRITWSIKA